jgi:ATP-dependent helicase HrpA
MKRTDVPLFEVLSRFVKERFGAEVPAAEWAKAEIPAYLRTRIAVIDHRGEEIAAGRNLDELRRAAAPTAMPEDSPEWTAARVKWEKEGLVAWDFGDLPESVKIGAFLVGYLGLQPAGKGVNIKLFKTRAEALASHQRGVETLLGLRFAKDLDFLRRYLVLPEEMEKAALYFGGKESLEKALQEHARREIFRRDIRAQEQYKAYAEGVMRALYEKSHLARESVEKILDRHQKLRRKIQEMEAGARSNKRIVSLCAELRAEVEALLPADFLERHALERLRHLPRYLEALEVRAERARNDPEKDAKKAAEVKPFSEALARLEKGLGGESSAEKREVVAEIRWMVEEFKVSLFAPELRTAFPISAKRLALKIKEITAMS